MDSSEFINVFIQKQKNLINELQSKLLLTETQLEIASNKLGAATEEVDKLKTDLEKAQKKQKPSE